MIITIEIDTTKKDAVTITTSEEIDVRTRDLPGFHHFIKLQLEEYFTKKCKEVYK